MLRRAFSENHLEPQLRIDANRTDLRSRGPGKDIRGIASFMITRRPVLLLLVGAFSAACSWSRAQRKSALASAPRPTASTHGEPGVGIPVGWASVSALDQNGTDGGGDGPRVEVSSINELAAAVANDAPQVVRIVQSMTGSVEIGSNKTVEGAPGVVFHGHVEINGSVNVILHDLKIVGYNCADRDPCKSGADAVSVTGAAHHIWFDHCDISDGSDGNFDINAGSDYITISWTKFSYSSRRAGGHQFSNLLSSSDDSDEDAGHLRVTFHHDWWADHVNERMPRVRFGQVHLFDNLYTATGNVYCVGVGHDANLLLENNAFFGVATPIESTRYSNAASVVVSRGNLYENTSGATADKGSDVFTPPYPYSLDPASAVRTMVTNGAGPRAR